MNSLSTRGHLRLVSDFHQQEAGDTIMLLNYWAQFMTAQDLSPRTIEERVNFIERLERDTTDIQTVTRQDLIRWTAGQGWANKTRVHYRSTLHTFFTWMQDEGFRLDNPAARLPKVRSRRREATPFTVEEIGTLLNSGVYRSTRAMIALHYYLGLRVSEIAAVNGDDIDRTRRTLTVTGKGRKTVVHPVPAALWGLCEVMPAAGYWFPNRAPNKFYGAGEGHVLGRSVSTLLSAAIRRAGLKHKPHDLRATTATEMNRAGVSAFIIQKGMRHTSMDTTVHYMGVDVEQVRDGLDLLPVIPMPVRSGRVA